MKFLLFPIKIFFLLFFFSSCSDTLSFDQVDLDIEPIVNVPEEALNCFLRTEMDVLVLENFIIKR